jgi:hypothetical protein
VRSSSRTPIGLSEPLAQVFAASEIGTHCGYMAAEHRAPPHPQRPTSARDVPDTNRAALQASCRPVTWRLAAQGST